MKLSLLLPTRNRLEYLGYALETVRRQHAQADWEIVVSDNDSEEDIAGHVAALDDPRITYVRTPRLLPVTENWNNALAHSTGDYVLMLGDDDGLLSGSLDEIAALAERHGRPDVIYTGAYLFAYPGVMPGHPKGYLQDYSYASFLRRAKAPYELDPERAHALVADAMGFRLRYGFNMQFAWISRRLIDELAPHGPFFQSQFPDYYAMNVAFMRARRIVADPRPHVVIGVTPKSYGFFHARSREREGQDFLDASRDVRGIPGSNINAGWLDAVETIERNFGSEAPAQPDRRRYRRLQISHVHEQAYVEGTIGAAELAELRPHLSGLEAAGWAAAGRAGALARRVLPDVLFRALRVCVHLRRGQLPLWRARKVEGAHATLLDVFEAHPVPGSAAGLDNGRGLAEDGGVGGAAARASLDG